MLEMNSITIVPGNTVLQTGLRDGDSGAFFLKCGNGANYIISLSTTVCLIAKIDKNGNRLQTATYGFFSNLSKEAIDIFFIFDQIYIISISTTTGLLCHAQSADFNDIKGVEYDPNLGTSSPVSWITVDDFNNLVPGATSASDVLIFYQASLGYTGEVYTGAFLYNFDVQSTSYDFTLTAFSLSIIATVAVVIYIIIFALYLPRIK